METQNNFAIGSIPKHIMSIAAVSYTHLDVYKRQVIFINMARAKP